MIKVTYYYQRNSSSKIVTYEPANSVITLPDALFTRLFYTQIGWTQSTKSNPPLQYYFFDEYQTGSKDIVFYAVWQFDLFGYSMQSDSTALTTPTPTVSVPPDVTPTPTPSPEPTPTPVPTPTPTATASGG